MEAALLWDTVATRDVTTAAHLNAHPRNLTVAVSDNMLIIVEQSRGFGLGTSTRYSALGY